MAREAKSPSEYRKKGAEVLAGVMPDTWAGHAIITIHDRDLSPDVREFAIKLVDRVSAKRDDVRADRLAEVAITKAEEKVGSN